MLMIFQNDDVYMMADLSAADFYTSCKYWFGSDKCVRGIKIVQHMGSF